MNDIISLDAYYLLYYFVAIFAASFAIPTGAMIIIVSFASVAAGLADLSILVILGLFATISGDYLAYLAASYFKKRLDGYVKRVAWLKNKSDLTGNIFQKYGGYTVFLTRFAISGLGPYVNLFSGLRSLPKSLFLKAVVGGEIIYIAIFVSVGYFFSETWQSVILIVKDYTVLAVLVAIGLAVSYRLGRLLLKEKFMQ